MLIVLSERYPFEYELLEHLAHGDDGTFAEYAQLSYSIIEHLVGYGLVTEQAGKYHFRVKAVEEYVKERSKVAKILTTKEEKWREISALRNKFEDSFRRVLRMVLKLQYGKKAKEVLLEIIPTERKDKLNLLNFDQIFTGRELYFDDLRRLVLKRWNDLGKIFNGDRDHFNTYMEYVNKYRADAHANDIADDDIGILLIALKWLQEQIDNFM